MFERVRSGSWLIGGQISGRAKLRTFLVLAPLAIVLLVVLRIQYSLVGYYLGRVVWTSDNFGPQLFYITGSAYDAAVIAVNSLRTKFDWQDVPVESELPTVQLRIEPNSIVRLSKTPAGQKIKTYYKAQLRYPDGTWHPIQYRFRGRNFQHRQIQKPSLRLKLRKRWPQMLQRHINLVVPEDRPMISNLFGEKIAVEMGLLTHSTHFVRLFINNEFKGVYHWTTREDQSLLARKERVQGPLFIGDNLSQRWKSAEFEVAGDTSFVKFIDPMKQLVAAMYSELGPSRYRALWDILSKEKYARWVAVNHLVGSIHTDFNHNNLFYFDPTFGQLEPIISDIQGHGSSLFPPYKYRIWNKFIPDHTIPINEKIYPLMDAALRDPTFYHLRNRLLYDAMHSFGAADRQRVELKKLFDKIEADAKADRHKNAAQNTFVGWYPIPYSNAQFDESKDVLYDWLVKRQDFLMGELEKSDVSVKIQGGSTQDGKIRFLVEVGSHAAVFFDPTKLGGGVFADYALDGSLTRGIGKKILLYPGIQDYIGDDWNLLTYGDRHHLIPGTQRYLFAVKGISLQFAMSKLRSAFIHAITGKAINPKVIRVSSGFNTGYAETKMGIHVWQLNEENSNTITLGPGIVDITEDLYVNEMQKLVISAGTEVRIGPGLSIISKGPVFFEGTSKHPVKLRRLDPERAWGGVAVVGNAASGSSIAHSDIQGGSHPASDQIRYTGMISIHGVGDINIQNCRFSGNSLSDDTLHIVYSRINLENLLLINCFGDCIDLDYASGNIDGVSIFQAGNDGIDLMGSRVELSSVSIDGVGDKGLSIGEQTKMKAYGINIKNSQIGIAVKDASEIRLVKSVLAENIVAIDVYKKHWMYGRPGLIEISATQFDENQVNLRTEVGGRAIFLDQSLPDKLTGVGDVWSMALPGS